MKPCEVTTHLKGNDGEGQKKTDPEPSGHVDQFFIRHDISRYEFRFERHAADGAGTGPNLTDLRVHRTGVDGSGRHRRRFLWIQVSLRLSGKLLHAFGAAEVKGATFVDGDVLGARGRHRHPTYGIDDRFRGVVAEMALGSVGMRVFHGLPYMP